MPSHAYGVGLVVQMSVRPMHMCLDLGHLDCQILLSCCRTLVISQFKKNAAVLQWVLLALELQILTLL